MAKLRPVLAIYPSSRPWFEEAAFSWHEDLKDTIKSWPGSKWMPASKRWRFPIELHETLVNTAIMLGFGVT